MQVSLKKKVLEGAHIIIWSWLQIGFTPRFFLYIPYLYPLNIRKNACFHSLHTLQESSPKRSQRQPKAPEQLPRPPNLGAHEDRGAPRWNRKIGTLWLFNIAMV